MKNFSFLLFLIMLVCFPTNICQAHAPNIDQDKLRQIYDKFYDENDNFKIQKLRFNNTDYLFVIGNYYDVFNDTQSSNADRIHRLNKVALYKHLDSGKDYSFNFIGFRKGILTVHSDEKNNYIKYTLISYIGEDDIQVIEEYEEEEIKTTASKDKDSIFDDKTYEFSTAKLFGKEISKKKYHNSEEYQYLLEQIEILENQIKIKEDNPYLLNQLYDLYLLKPDLEKAFEIKNRLFELRFQ